MGDTWRDKARPIIARVLRETAGQDEKAIKRALRDAYPFGPRQYHPYKIWCDEVQAQRGLKVVKPKPMDIDPNQSILFPETVTAYEIKVSRADFLKDNKWPAYLPLCNQFYFVAPPNLIDISELPADAGLLTTAGSRLLTKKKAPHRNVVIPEEVYRYILMCRVSITRDRWQMDDEDRAAYWRKFIQAKDENRKLGFEVSRAIRNHVTAVESENKELKRQMESYDDVRQLLTQLGIQTDYHTSRRTVEDKLREQEEIFPKATVWAMRDLLRSLERALQILEPKKENEQAA